MNMELRDKKKHNVSLKGYLEDFKYAKDGLKSAYQNEQIMTLHFFTTLFIIFLCILLKASAIEWAASILLLGLIAGMELINTALEAVIDLICPKIHPLAKVGKDTASAAVAVLSCLSFLFWTILFGPRLIMLIGNLF